MTVRSCCWNWMKNCKRKKMRTGKTSWSYKMRS
jgi:hypothetical protein